MRSLSLNAMALTALLGFCLAGCASAPKKSHKKPVPTPAERLALKQYKMGIDAYANTRYSEAIKHWKLTLANDPTDATDVTGNAAAYIGRAEAMLKATKDVKNSPAMVTTPAP
jgi:hypothetical protein